MKKCKYLLFIVFAFILFIFCSNVYAAADCDNYACATCVYSNSYGTFTYDIKSLGDGSVSLDFSADTTTGRISAVNEIPSSYFINSTTNKIQCYPIKMTVTYTGGSGRATLGTKGTNDLTPTEASTNNDKLLTKGDIVSISCDYSGDLATCTVTATETTMSFSCNNGFQVSNNRMTVEDFGYGTKCPTLSLLCSRRGGNYCSLLKPGDLGTDVEGEETQTGDEIYKPEVEDTDDSEIDWGEKVETNCEGIIGEDALDFINQIFRWIQIIAPIFVIIISGVEFGGAVLLDDKDALKKASSKLIKRLIIAVALFFVPMILSFVLDVFNEASGSFASTCGIGE